MDLKKKPSEPFYNLVDQLVIDMAKYGDLLIRRDRYGETGLDEQITQMKQTIEIKRAIAEGQQKRY